MTQRETFWEFFDRIAGPQRTGRQTPLPPINPVGCVPMQRFSPRIGLTSENRLHIAGCERCQRALAAAWRVNCPGLRELYPYAKAGSEYLLAPVMTRHLRHCRRCALIVRFLELGSLIMSFPNGAAQMVAPMLLEGARAATVREDQSSAVMNLTIDASQRVEVLVQVEGETVSIDASADGLDLIGKRLSVDIWDDSGCTTYGARFQEAGGNATAHTEGPISKLRARSFARQGVAVACVDSAVESD